MLTISNYSQSIKRSQIKNIQNGPNWTETLISGAVPSRGGQVGINSWFTPLEKNF